MNQAFNLESNSLLTFTLVVLRIYASCSWPYSLHAGCYQHGNVYPFRLQLIADRPIEERG